MTPNFGSRFIYLYVSLCLFSFSLSPSTVRIALFLIQQIIMYLLCSVYCIDLYLMTLGEVIVKLSLLNRCCDGWRKAFEQLIHGIRVSVFSKNVTYMFVTKCNYILVQIISEMLPPSSFSRDILIFLAGKFEIEVPVCLKLRILLSLVRFTFLYFHFWVR